MRNPTKARSAAQRLPGTGVACWCAEESHTRSYPPSLIGVLLAAGFFWYVAPEIARDEMGSVVAARFSWVADTTDRVARLLRDPMTTTTTAFGRDVYADAPRPAPRRADPVRQVTGGTITKTS